MACHAPVDYACKLAYNFDDQTVIMRPVVQDFDLRAISDFQFSLDSVAICFDSVSILFALLVSIGIPSGIVSFHSVVQSVPICLEGTLQINININININKVK